MGDSGQWASALRSLGGAAWEEGRSHCELGTSLLKARGAGTPPILTCQLPLPGAPSRGQMGTGPSLGPRGCPHLTRFRSEDYTVHVRLGDYLDIICPHYEPASVADAAMEQYTLYLVEREQYQLCQPQSKNQVRWQCDRPSARHGPEKLSEKFQRFTPFTLGKEFKEGHSYYYISKPIYHQEDRCLRLKVTVSGKITHSPQAHANPQEKRLPADDPEVQVLHSVGHSAAPRLFPLVWAVLLLPFLLLQTP
ncbi:ephrin-A1 isoform X1 [Pteropus medius]|uniref:ephrin-A1 isoform X1 n=1 Tax=Pteropus vampyrus TaxID=132908 RepID=UPI00196ACAF9|nr:ephrin-A1 isoform X1 [Pteropus giganteus]